ncbi:putative ArsR family transcriptional regulator [Kineosphaera limosa]|uniref:Uncharacterized protein n=1 Tax=Kineosphaera limosa NBRC 100340 TaxID=1184609 RepID=K6XHD7_9MICO|nr:helix-turn-helix domain-containing protein [Kineosphaera limosa]NYE01589.1 putative ArsR family transcriptional regulator [Kineosphaera limosa]GAB98249.1 hypothetical protein KILIM_117_00060 [Kineosphaera limosa NBRC 100340]
MPDIPEVAGELGPRPTPLHHDPTTQLSSPRAMVLDALGAAPGSATVHQLAATLGQHTNTVREHLDALVELGLASRLRGTPVGRGRPAIRYAAIPPERSRPQLREYATLASVLAEQLAASSHDPAGEAIAAGHCWGEALGTSGPDGSAAARARTLSILNNLGFDPVQRPDGSVDLRSCPLLAAARANPTVVCGVHLGLVQSLYRGHEAPAQEVGLDPFARVGACVLRLPPPERSPDPTSDKDEGPGTPAELPPADFG